MIDVDAIRGEGYFNSDDWNEETITQLCDEVERLRKRIDLMDEYWAPPTMLCEVIGCEQEITSGRIRLDGSYWCMCSKHWTDKGEFKRKPGNEYIGGRTAQEVGYE